MARINIKFSCGEKVSCGGVPGIVTALFIRGKGRSYEFSYVDHNGNPTCVTAQECELKSESLAKSGFGEG